MKESIKKKLLSFQINHTEKLIEIINKNKSALDSSSAGTGKTFAAMALTKHFGYAPIIICPKSTISQWTRIAKLFNVNPLFIVNYETIKLGKYYVNRNRVKCPYIEIKDEEYRWIVPDNIIFIFDEVHKCRLSNQNGKLLLATKILDKSLLMLSATVADNPDKFKIFMYMLNFLDPEEVKENEISFKKYMHILDKWLLGEHQAMIRLYQMLYPNRASRIRIQDLGDLFPETQIIAESYTMGRTREIEIENQYKIIAEGIDELKNKKKKDKSNPLVLIMRAHQKIELLKVPTFVELANDFLVNNFSVVIFVNFTQTLETLAKMLHTDCLIYGKLDEKIRQKNIDNFQSNKSRIIICNIKAGGVGISLHDIHGDHPRASLISPSWSSIDLVQSLGRVHRANGKSKSLQRIIYCSNTIEEEVACKLKKKLTNINAINDGDLDLSGITFKEQPIC